MDESRIVWASYDGDLRVVYRPAAPLDIAVVVEMKTKDALGAVIWLSVTATPRLEKAHRGMARTLYDQQISKTTDPADSGEPKPRN